MTKHRLCGLRQPDDRASSRGIRPRPLLRSGLLLEHLDPARLLTTMDTREASRHRQITHNRPSSASTLTKRAPMTDPDVDLMTHRRTQDPIAQAYYVKDKKKVKVRTRSTSP